MVIRAPLYPDHAVIIALAIVGVTPCRASIRRGGRARAAGRRDQARLMPDHGGGNAMSGKEDEPVVVMEE